MLKIRLQRVGRKNEPSFRLVLTDSKNSTKSGRFKEILGSYDARKAVDSIKADRVKHWMSQGAGITDSVHNLLLNHKIIEGKKKNVLPRKSPPKVEEAPKAEVKAEAKEEVKKEEVAPVEKAPEAPAESAPEVVQ